MLFPSLQQPEVLFTDYLSLLYDCFISFSSLLSMDCSCTTPMTSFDKLILHNKYFIKKFSKSCSVSVAISFLLLILGYICKSCRRVKLCFKVYLLLNWKWMIIQFIIAVFLTWYESRIINLSNSVSVTQFSLHQSLSCCRVCLFVCDVTDLCLTKCDTLQPVIP